MRALAAVVTGGAIAAVGALLLGEYELDGPTPLIGGVLFGLILAEAVMAVSGRRDALVAGLSGVLVVAGMLGAAWISSGNDWSFVPALGWVGVVVAGAAAGAWVRVPGRRASGSPRGT